MSTWVSDTFMSVCGERAESQPQEVCFSHNGAEKGHSVMYSLQQLQCAPMVQLLF